MEIVADANIFLCVVLGEGERDWIINNTLGYDIVSPEILPYEIGNALISLKKRKKLRDEEVNKAFEISQKIRVKLTPVDMAKSLRIALAYNIYAYDAYYLQCCLGQKLPLISLDQQMCDIGQLLGIRVVQKI